MLTLPAFLLGTVSALAVAGASGPSALSAPSIVGVAASGNTLTVTPGSYTGAATVTGQWQKNGKPISGATGTSYTVQANDGPNIAYLETATSAGGQATTQRALSKYLGQVATKTRIPTRWASGNKQIMVRCPFIARDDIASLQILLPNWYWASTQNSGGDHAEHGSGGTATFTASVEYPAGTFTQIKFGGSASIVAADNTDTLSDAVAVAVPKGAAAFIRVFAVFSSGIVFWDQGDYVNGQQLAYAASGLTDQTMGGTITNTATPGTGSGAVNGGTSSANTLGFGPTAIIAQTALPSVLLSGDSRVDGWSDTIGDASGDMGELARSIGPSLAYINAGSWGDQAALYNASHAHRQALAKYCSHVICEQGINDLTAGGASAATLEASQNTLWTAFANMGLPVFASTIPPVTTSASDHWASSAGQTLAASNAARTAVNDNIRTTPAPLAGFFEVADQIETARNSGLWKSNGSAYGYTLDGTHENQAGYLLIKNSGAINPAVFTR